MTMLHYTRALFHATTELSKAAYDAGISDKTLADTVLTIGADDSGQLDFSELVEIYRNRTPRDAAIMGLIDIAAFWKYQDWRTKEVGTSVFGMYSILCCAAAVALAEKEWVNTPDVPQVIGQAVEERLKSNFGYAMQKGRMAFDDVGDAGSGGIKDEEGPDTYSER